MPPPSPAADDYDYLGLNFRYSGAWNEINVRIAQRQNLISIYTALMLPMIGAGLLQQSNDYIWRLIYGVPLVTLIFAILLRMHELMIGNLLNFLRICEEWSNAERGLPGYHLRQQPWADTSSALRRGHDWAVVLLMLGFNAVACAIFVAHRNAVTQIEQWAAVAITFIGVYAMWQVLSISNDRHRLSDPPKYSPSGSASNSSAQEGAT